MKRTTLILATVLFVTTGLFAQDKKDKKILKDAEKAKAKFMKMDLNEFFSEAEAYVIFPNVGEGAFIVGGASGNGVLYENGTTTGMAKLKKVDVGLQAGGEAYSEIIFFETEEALQRFKDDDFEFAARASAVALKSGKSVNAKYNDGVAVFAMSKGGLMADASVGGQKFEYIPFDEAKKVDKMKK